MLLDPRLRGDDTPDRGNVLVIILIAIALMAGLTMAVMRSDVTDSDSVSPEQAKVMGSQIMSQARNFEQAITTLNARGCSEQDINFDNDAVVGYTNASAPADQTCNVFKQAGSGLSWPAPPTASNDGSAWRILAGNAIKGVTRTDDGTCVSGCIDILAVLPHVTKTVCQQLNALASVTSATAAPPVNVGNFDGATKMAGFDAVAAGSLVSDAGDVLTGKPTGCFEATNVSGVAENGTYWFYHVILKR